VAKGTSVAPEADRLEGAGVSIELPTGWQGRVLIPAVVQVANFEFVPVGISLPPGEEDPIKAMTAKHALVSVLPCGLVSWEEAAHAAPKQIALDDLTFLPEKDPRVPWRHARAHGSFEFGERCLDIEVDFGAAQPLRTLTNTVNDVLASLVVAER
jgi:hypothetical protein